jgi:HEAT repeat protein
MNQTHLSRGKTFLFAAFWVLLLVVHSPYASLARTVEDYLKAFQDKRPEVRMSALKSDELARCYAEGADERDCPLKGEDFNRLTSAFIDLLSDPKPEIRKQAAQYLISSTDSRVIGPLARLLADRDDEVRAVAARAFVLMQVHDEEIVGDLEKLLLDKDKRVRSGAAMSLVLNGSRRSLDRLTEAYDRETDPDVKKLLAETIKQLAGRTRK